MSKDSVKRRSESSWHALPSARVVELLDPEFVEDEAAEMREELHEVRATVEGWTQRGFER